MNKKKFANLARAPTDPQYFPLAKALKLMTNYFEIISLQIKTTSSK